MEILILILQGDINWQTRIYTNFLFSRGQSRTPVPTSNFIFKQQTQRFLNQITLLSNKGKTYEEIIDILDPYQITLLSNLKLRRSAQSRGIVQFGKCAWLAFEPCVFSFKGYSSKKCCGCFSSEKLFCFVCRSSVKQAGQINLLLNKDGKREHIISVLDPYKITLLSNCNEKGV